MKKNQGIVQTIIIIILALVILSLLGISLQSLFNNATLKDNFIFAWETVVHTWNTYLAPYARSLWSTVSQKV